MHTLHHPTISHILPRSLSSPLPLVPRTPRVNASPWLRLEPAVGTDTRSLPPSIPPGARVARACPRHHPYVSSHRSCRGPGLGWTPGCRA